MLQTYNKAHRCGRKYLVSPLGQYLPPMSLLPAISINGIWTQFVLLGILVYVPIIFFLLFFFFLSFIHFSSFNVIATPLLRSVSRIKIFLKSRSIRERSEFGRETNRFVINSNKLQLERTSCLSLSFFIEFLKQMDRRNICHKFVIKFLPILRRICSGVIS